MNAELLAAVKALRACFAEGEAMPTSGRKASFYVGASQHHMDYCIDNLDAALAEKPEPAAPAPRVDDAEAVEKLVECIYCKGGGYYVGVDGKDAACPTCKRTQSAREVGAVIASNGVLSQREAEALVDHFSMAVEGECEGVDDGITGVRNIRAQVIAGLMRRPAPRESSGLLEAAEAFFRSVDECQSYGDKNRAMVDLRAAFLAAKEAKRGGAKGGEA